MMATKTTPARASPTAPRRSAATASSVSVKSCDDGNQDPDDECDECRPKVCGDESSVPESSAMTAT